MKQLVITVLLFSACGHDQGNIDNDVGAPCAANADCADRCFVDANDHFPGGFCSSACISDRDCPADTYCITTAGGVCAFACPAFDCRRLGVGWNCKDKDDASGGKVTVCIGG